jgi:hypothetical protein
MPLVRAWMRGLSAASGAAVLVPGGIFVALPLLALAGSFGRIGGLGQASNGPAAPVAAPVANASQGSGGSAPALLGVVSSPALTSAAPAVRNPAVGEAGGIARQSASATRPGSTSGLRGGRPGGAPPAPGTPSLPTGSGGCLSCGQPLPHQTLVDQVVNLGTSITNKLPGPVGRLTTRLLKQVGTSVDKVLPIDRRPGDAVTRLGSTLSKLKLP